MERFYRFTKYKSSFHITLWYKIPEEEFEIMKKDIESQLPIHVEGSSYKIVLMKEHEAKEIYILLQQKNKIYYFNYKNYSILATKSESGPSVIALASVSSISNVAGSGESINSHDDARHSQITTL